MISFIQAAKLLSENKFEAFERELENGFDINIVASVGSNMLYWFFTNPQMCEYLLSKGADPNVKSGHKHDAFVNVCGDYGGNNWEHIKLYINHGIHISKRDGFGKSGLDNMIEQGHINLIKEMMEYEDQMDEKDKEKIKKYRLKVLFT